MQSSFYIKRGKRAFDIALASTALITLSPLLLMIAVLVKLTSKGGVFYVQKRVGRDFKEFYLYKFRSMKSGSEGLLITSGDDPRITPFGRFLRDSKLDELPQLFNILKGDMSFVGPRPEVKRYVDLNKKIYKKILLVRPGLTDLAAIEFRDEERMLSKYEDKEKAYIDIILPKKIELYLKYIKEISFKNDISIILKTVRVL